MIDTKKALMMTGCTEKEADEQIKKGAYVCTYDEYVELLIGNGFEEDVAEFTEAYNNAGQIDIKFYEGLDIVSEDGVKYIVAEIL